MIELASLRIRYSVGNESKVEKEKRSNNGWERHGRGVVTLRHPNYTVTCFGVITSI